jgi:glutamyl endopeptidase
MKKFIINFIRTKVVDILFAIIIWISLAFSIAGSNLVQGVQAQPEQPPDGKISPDQGQSIDGVIGDDNRVRVEATTEFPWRAIADIDVYFPENTVTCTGFFIGPHTVATAGHCIFNSNEGGWATSVKIMPGRNSFSTPFGSQTVSTNNLRAPTQWVDSNNPEYDYGAIILTNDTIGKQVGWYKYESLTDDELLGQLINVSGYPGDKPDPACMILPACQLWRDTDPITAVRSRIINYAADTYSGQSGSPVWFFDGYWKAVGIHTRSFGDSTCDPENNCGTRMSPDVVQDLLTWSGYDFPPLTTDSANFVANITIPDGWAVDSGETLTKTWRIRNSGTTNWGSGYQLVFIGGEQMGSPGVVDVPPTAPGEEVNVSVNFTAPAEGGYYRNNWQLRNAQGTYFGPVFWLGINVPNGPAPPPPPAGDVDDIELSCLDCPTVLTPGQTYRPTIRATVNQGQLLESRGDLLLNTDGNLYDAWPHVAVMGTVSPGETYDFTFYEEDPLVAPSAEGTYETRWRAWADGNWVGQEITIRFDVRSGGGTRPDPPSLVSPGNWYVSHDGTTPNLCASAPAGLEYYFQIYESHTTPASGWTSNSCWTPPGLGSHGYQWHVRVRDPGSGIVSEWSETWHFNIDSTTPSIDDTRFNPDSGSSVDTVKIYACADFQYEVHVNTATDGSANGEWRMIANALPRDCKPEEDKNWINWWTLPLEDGLHRLKFIVFKNDQSMVKDDVTYQLNYRRPGGPTHISPNHEAWLNSRTVTFRWSSSPRADNYNLIVATDIPQQNQVLNLNLGGSTTSYTAEFTEDYPQLYWWVDASNSVGVTTSGYRPFGIDRVNPSSSVTSLDAVSLETAFQVSWSGTDDLSGLRWYDVQVRDATHSGSSWHDWMQSTEETTALFKGQPGHTYCFRSRAMDTASNWEAYPAAETGDTCTSVDPTAAPSTPWWDTGYAYKANIVVLNNDSQTLPQYYPIRLHLDTSTNPTAAQIYNASLSPVKGDDVRIIWNNLTETTRVIQTFSSTAIDIWFRFAGTIPPLSSDSTTFQIYYSNSAAQNPPDDINFVFPPQNDSFTNNLGIWHFNEGTGTTIHDSSENDQHGTASFMGWGSGKFGPAGDFNGTNAVVNTGTSDQFYLTNLSLEAWIYSDGGGEQSIIRKAVSSTDSGLVYDFIVQGEEVWLRLNGIEGNAHSEAILQHDRWYHIAGTYDGSTIKIFVNGETKPEWSSAYNQPLRTGDYSTLYIGGDGRNDNKYFNGMIQHVRVSDIARSSFPFGEYGKITNEPTTAIGDPVTQPIEGTVDLAILDLDAYPNPDGGFILQALVENQGEINTQNGFYTDIYLDHLPTGGGDYTGSVQFWVNDPIEPGAQVTLTTVIADLPSLLMGGAQILSPASEITATIYGQVDSAGKVTETDEGNNITDQGTEICVAAPDAYENDDSSESASLITVGETQTHNIDHISDQDWIKLNAQAGISYTLTTLDLDVSADTVMALYDSDGKTLLMKNDDYSGSLSSRIEWVPPISGVYYIQIKHWNPNSSGCGTSYKVTLSEASPKVEPNDIFLPFMGTDLYPRITTDTFNGMKADAELFNHQCNTFEECRTAQYGSGYWSDLGGGTISATYTDGKYFINRIFLFFDTSALPEGATILDAKLKIYAGPFQHGSNKIHVVPTSAGVPVTFSDFGNLEFISGGSSEPPTNTWIGIQLLPKALKWVNVGGVTSLALIHDYDFTGTTPIDANDLIVSLADDSNQNYPVLEITYIP